MIYAKSDNEEKIKATPGSKAFCPLCDQPVIAKCGQINIWHWAHESLRDCDSWSEGEGEWHLGWKELVDPKQTEVSITRDGILHRADIVLEDGTVLELQHSPISPDKIKEREDFYGKMIWLFDIRDAGDRIHRGLYLNYDCIHAANNNDFIPYFRRLASSNLHPAIKYMSWQSREVLYYKLEDFYESHHFSWNWAKKSIATCNKPVILDCGDRAIAVKKFLRGARHMAGNSHARDIVITSIKTQKLEDLFQTDVFNWELEILESIQEAQEESKPKQDTTWPKTLADSIAQNHKERQRILGIV